ncbi:tetratricopeptide repeat protein [[Actinomadura] parvosata]|uniref:tetratricopeptide repeat protein n=1 Tax=[Actinomadura] parvosata TaxID=1955412 RepID=UPI00406C1BF6
MVEAGGTLTSRNDLAGAYQTAGDLGRAIPLLEATLANCERLLGVNHPTTRVVRVNLEVTVAAGAARPSAGWWRRILPRCGRPNR